MALQGLAVAVAGLVPLWLVLAVLAASPVEVLAAVVHPSQVVQQPQAEQVEAAS